MDGNCQKPYLDSILITKVPHYTGNNGKPPKIISFLMKNPIFKYTISTDKSQKCQKYDLFGEFYGRKWSEITP